MQWSHGKIHLTRWVFQHFDSDSFPVSGLLSSEINESQSILSKSNKKVFSLPAAPFTIETRDLGIPTSLDRNKINAAFAFPSVAGAAIRIQS